MSILLFYDLNKFRYFKSAQLFPSLGCLEIKRKENKTKQKNLTKQPNILLEKQRTWLFLNVAVSLESKKAFFWVSRLEPFVLKMHLPYRVCERLH